ncbi:MAG: hypothetical protein HOV94_03465, partial [Saccharothrix sp.]|nr:hypothetical protein [Saccharothrix sp.]
MSSRSDEPHGGVAEVARLVADSLAALSGRTVAVAALVAHDAGDETDRAAEFLGQALTPPPSGLVLVLFTVDGEPYEQYADPTADRCALARDLALGLADQVHEAERGAPFPPCPGHPHPLTLT